MEHSRTRGADVRKQPLRTLGWIAGLMLLSAGMAPSAEEAERQPDPTRYDMDFRFTYVPVTYPFKGPLDFKFDSMHALFEYGARCAEAGRLWTTLQHAINEALRAAATTSRQTDDCPVPDGGP